MSARKRWNLTDGATYTIADLHAMDPRLADAARRKLGDVSAALKQVRSAGATLRTDRVAPPEPERKWEPDRSWNRLGDQLPPERRRPPSVE